MAIFYFDTSALVKRYRPEQGTAVVDELWDNITPADRFCGSFLCLLEFTSAILRQANTGSLEERAADELLSRFRREARNDFDFWPIDSETIQAAMLVVETHRLRSADAIHLATALTISQAAPNARFVLVTADREMLVAAEASSLAVIDPTHADASETLRLFRR